MKVDETHSGSLIIPMPDRNDGLLTNVSLIRMIVVFCGQVLAQMCPLLQINRSNHMRRDRWEVIVSTREEMCSEKA